MADASGDGFTCPFCGQVLASQARLTDHFEADHDMAGFDP